MNDDWHEQRNRIIGLGENSFKKSYYPELQAKISELELSYTNLQSIFNSITDGIIIHDEHGKILLINNQSQKIFNINFIDIETLIITDFSAPNMNNQYLFNIWKDVLSGCSRIIDWVIIQNNTNNVIPVQISINKTIWYGKNVLVSVVRDFSERIKIEHELLKAKEKAEESDRLKTAFLSNMSHEIRTPINGILGFLKLLQTQDLSVQEKNEFINIVNINTHRLLNTINDILEISKIDAGQISVNLSSVNICEIITYCYELYELKALDKGLTIKIEKCLNNEDAIIITDRFRIEGILNHLLNNAIKFTSNGSVVFGNYLEDNSLVFYVKDTGMGIPQDKLDAIFDRFVQADLEHTRLYEGSGLGLSIVKAYIEMLKGKIWVESEINIGSTFYFSIDYKKGDKNNLDDE